MIFFRTFVRLIKTKTVFIILIILIAVSSYKAYSSESNNALKVVYITDLNLYPTPIASRQDKHLLERTNGLLLYESQAVLQEIIGHINKYFDFDFVVFGGNNIFDCSREGCKHENPWQLFFDIIFEIKSDVLFTFGKNEVHLFKFNDFINTLSTYKVDVQNTWWLKNKGDFLLVGLNSFYFFSNDSNTANEQIKWLKGLLQKNKNKLTIIFLHESPINEKGEFVQNKFISQFLETIKSNKQVKAVISGNQYLDRSRLISDTAYIISPSPVVYPCGFKFIEITKNSLKVKTIYVPLKGIVKKAEKSLISSTRAVSIYPKDPKLIKKYVLGEKTDTDFKFLF